ncbi:hypothetical protein LINPERPRIM_LOCUS5926 [Linum perenne]
MDPINYETVMLLMKNLSMNLSSPRFELVVGSVKNICFTCFLIRCFVGGTGTAAEITSTGTTNTKRTRRKKKLAELGEEECFLWKEWRLSGNRQKNRKEDW